jgi:hypothetical protein
MADVQERLKKLGQAGRIGEWIYLEIDAILG